MCDESSLTGESHPVQKIECPNDPTARYTIKGAQRYTLFAGTTLLQCERGQFNDVLAVVVATGIQTGKGQLISHILYPQRILFKYDEELPIVAGVLIIFALIVFPVAIWFQVRLPTTCTCYQFGSWQRESPAPRAQALAVRRAVPGSPGPGRLGLGAQTSGSQKPGSPAPRSADVRRLGATQARAGFHVATISRGGFCSLPWPRV